MTDMSGFKRSSRIVLKVDAGVAAATPVAGLPTNMWGLRDDYLLHRGLLSILSTRLLLGLDGVE